MSSTRSRTAFAVPLTTALAATLATSVAVSVAVLAPTTPAAATDWGRCLSGPADRQAVFTRAAEVSGVPASVLLGVSYLQGRWDDHGASPSTSGGYGPMHLVQVDTAAVTEEHAQGKGESTGEHDGRALGRPLVGTPGIGPDAAGLSTLATAAELVDVTPARLRRDDVANICGGAALLAQHQREAAPEQTGATAPRAWSAAVARYSGAADRATATRFAEQVFAVVRDGRARTTNDGHRVRLAAHPARVDRAQVARAFPRSTSDDGVICPASLGCESLPAPYEQYGSSPGAYGNHDLADRERDLDIDYIVIHDTEATWDTTLQLVQRPDYLAWDYSLRSRDGHIAQHLDGTDVGWHAGNWYVNMHAVGLEHEGFAAEGASWYTESMYQTSAALVRHLAERYDVPLDRAHIIGHDQIPGHVPSRVPAMHWDPGPYWDWEHYFDLLGAPIADAPGRSGGAVDERRGIRVGDVVTVAPGYEGNANPLTGCGEEPCETGATNFVYLRQAPDASAPLVNDPGLHPDGEPQTTRVSDIGARVAAGQQLVVAQRRPGWVGVWWLGELAWMPARGATGEPTAGTDRGRVVVPRGDEAVPVYGRAYPEASAYPEEIPVQDLVPLQYEIRPGQAYALADRDPQTGYYYAKSFQCATVPGDCTHVEGDQDYVQIWFGHRYVYVLADDVRVRRG